jgi:hypothetical protein
MPVKKKRVEDKKNSREKEKKTTNANENKNNNLQNESYLHEDRSVK